MKSTWMQVVLVLSLMGCDPESAEEEAPAEQAPPWEQKDEEAAGFILEACELANASSSGGVVRIDIQRYRAQGLERLEPWFAVPDVGLEGDEVGSVTILHSLTSQRSAYAFDGRYDRTDVRARAQKVAGKTYFGDHMGDVGYGGNGAFQLGFLRDRFVIGVNAISYIKARAQSKRPLNELPAVKELAGRTRFRDLVVLAQQWRMSGVRAQLLISYRFLPDERAFMQHLTHATSEEGARKLEGLIKNLAEAPNVKRSKLTRDGAWVELVMEVSRVEITYPGMVPRPKKGFVFKLP